MSRNFSSMSGLSHTAPVENRYLSSCASARFMDGMSSTQCGHQVAQKACRR